MARTCASASAPTRAGGRRTNLTGAMPTSISSPRWTRQAVIVSSRPRRIRTSRSGFEAARDHTLDAHALQWRFVRTSDHDHAPRAVRHGVLWGRQDECRPRQGEDDKNGDDPSIRFHGQRSTAHPVTVELRGARWTSVAVDPIGIGTGISVGITSGVAVALVEIWPRIPVAEAGGISVDEGTCVEEGAPEELRLDLRSIVVESGMEAARVGQAGRQRESQESQNEHELFHGHTSCSLRRLRRCRRFPEEDSPASYLSSPVGSTVRPAVRGRAGPVAAMYADT